MKREDYERLGPPCRVVKNYDAEFAFGRVLDVASVSGEIVDGETPVPELAGIIIEMAGQETRLMVHLSKAECDGVIRALIACRNHLWPGP